MENVNIVCKILFAFVLLLPPLFASIVEFDNKNESIIKEWNQRKKKKELSKYIHIQNRASEKKKQQWRKRRTSRHLANGIGLGKRRAEGGKKKVELEDWIQNQERTES